MPGVHSPIPLSSTPHFPPLRDEDGTVRVPEHLPNHPPFPVTRRRHVILDDEAVPVPFVRDVLASMAYPMLDSVLHSPVFAVDDDTGNTEPDSKRLVVVSAPLPYPNCVLVVSFDDRPDDVFETPAHGLVWATSGSTLFEPLFDLADAPGSLSDDPESPTTETLLTLPVFYLHLPFHHAWTQLHDFMYTRSTAEFLDTLAMPISSSTQHTQSIPTNAGPSALDQGDLVDQLESLRQLYLTAHSLQLPDDALWDVMHAEWSRLCKLHHESSRA